MIKKNCCLHIIKHLTLLDNKISIESIFEHCIKTNHVLICKTQWLQSLQQCFNVTQQQNVKFTIGKNTIWHPGGQWSTFCSHYFLCMYLQKCKSWFFKTVHKSWESLVALQLSSACWYVLWKNESEKQSKTNFLLVHQKRRNFLTWKMVVSMTKKESRCMERIRDQVQIGKESAYMEA